MKVIVGLGNVGEKYNGTRHNIGFGVVDQLAGDKSWKESLKFKALMCEVDGVMLVKPTTLMNASGVAVSKIVGFYKIDLDDVWVIHDDLDIEIGKYLIQKGVGPKIHNGVNSVEESLGKKEFWRVRVGVDGRKGERNIPGDEYVLSSFRPEERDVIEEVVDRVVMELKEKLKN